VLRVAGLSASLHDAVTSALLEGDDTLALVIREGADKLMMSGQASVGLDTRGLVFLGGAKATLALKAAEALPVQWLFVTCVAEHRAGTLFAQFLLRELRLITKTRKFVVWFGASGLFFDTNLYDSRELQSKYTACLRASSETFDELPGNGLFAYVGTIPEERRITPLVVGNTGGLFVFSDQPELPQFGAFVAQFAEQRSKWLRNVTSRHLTPIYTEAANEILIVAKQSLAGVSADTCAALRVISCARVNIDEEMETSLITVLGKCRDLVVLSLQGASCSAEACRRIAHAVDRLVASRSLLYFQAIFVGDSLCDTLCGFGALPTWCLPFDDRRQQSILRPKEREEAALLRTFISVRV
jgi:hypothetical protein